MGVFESILSKGMQAGQMPAKTQEARNWYRLMARSQGATIRQTGKDAGRIDFGRARDFNLAKDYADRGTMTIFPGSMYMYHYDAKHKDTLPFWDKFPVMFPFRVESDRFWGLNLHYADYRARSVILDTLYDLANNQRYDETTKLQMSYKALQSLAKFKYIKPCVKQYLFSHLQSKAIYILPSEWDICAWLPCENFIGKTKSQVWANSRSKY